MLFLTLKMAAISQGQGRIRSYSRTRCSFNTPSNIPTKFRWNNQHRLGEKRKNVISYFNHKIKITRLFEVKSADKVALTPSNVPNKVLFE